MLVLLVCLQPVLGNEPAASCSVGAATASNPCCSLLAVSSTRIDHALLGLSMGLSTDRMVLCFEFNKANIAQAQQKQADVNKLSALYESQNCWGGEIAKAAGDSVFSLDTRQEFARHLQQAHCQVPFQVDGNWTDQLLAPNSRG